MRTKLIVALRAAAEEVEKNPDHYDWERMDMCNCGLVAKHITGKEEAAIELRTHPDWNGIWGECGMQAKNCESTGAPIPEVIRQLHGAGLKWEEFWDLEKLANVAVLDALKVPNRMRGRWSDRIYWGSFDLPEAFIAYARKWADMMEKGELE